MRTGRPWLRGTYLPLQNYGTWPREGHLSTPPELRNMVPRGLLTYLPPRNRGTVAPQPTIPGKGTKPYGDFLICDIDARGSCDLLLHEGAATSGAVCMTAPRRTTV